MTDTDFLDPKLCEEFNKAIDESPIFTDDECYNCLFNLICVAMDRIDTCPISNERNTSVVEQYRDYIRSKIGELCDAVDALDMESQDGIEMSMIRFSPENMHKMYHYQIQKIFSYLHEKSEEVEPGSNEEWSLIQADNFYNEFGHKWVYMEPYKMSYTEIHLLVTVACYMEEKKQKGVKSI